MPNYPPPPPLLPPLLGAMHHTRLPPWSSTCMPSNLLASCEFTKIQGMLRCLMLPEAAAGVLTLLQKLLLKKLVHGDTQVLMMTRPMRAVWTTSFPSQILQR